MWSRTGGRDGMTNRRMESPDDSTSNPDCQTPARKRSPGLNRGNEIKKMLGRDSTLKPVAEGWPLDYKTRPVFETLIAFNSDGVENVIPTPDRYPRLVTAPSA